MTRTDLPTFFARIWGTTTVTVSASATAEAYNPSGLASHWEQPCSGGFHLRKALAAAQHGSQLARLPTVTSSIPRAARSRIPASLGLSRLIRPHPQTVCTRSAPAAVAAVRLPPLVWQYYPADFSNFTLPSSTSVSCSLVGPGGLSQQQLNVAGCVQTPIACNQTMGIDSTAYTSLDSDTATAVDCLTHSTTSDGDKVDETTNPNFPYEPFEFLAGTDNPIVAAGGTPGLSAGTDVMVSDSLVTVPVFNIDICRPRPFCSDYRFCSTVSPAGRKSSASNRQRLSQQHNQNHGHQHGGMWYQSRQFNCSAGLRQRSFCRPSAFDLASGTSQLAGR